MDLGRIGISSGTAILTRAGLTSMAGQQLAGSRYLRWSVTAAAVIGWLTRHPPTTVLAAALSILAVLVTHQLVRSVLRGQTRCTGSTDRPGRRHLIVVSVAALLFLTGAPSAWAVPEGDYCRAAPTPEATGTGVTGLLDPQAALPMDGTIYGDRGYAGLFWYAYDPGCTAAAGEALLGQTGATVAGAFDGSGSAGDTQAGNILLKIAKLELAATTGMRARAMDLDYFTGLDSIMTAGISALNDLLITPWLGLPLFVLGLILAVLARRGRAPETAHRVLVALAGLGLIGFLGQYPLAVSGWADGKIVALQQGMDRGFLARLPETITPTLRYCHYDYTQFEQPPTWDNGEQVIVGTACTTQIRPTLNAADSELTTGNDGIPRRYDPTYFETNFYPEVMIETLIVPYWQQGLLGTTDRSGPNYDLARTFLRGQSVTRFEAAADAYGTAAAATAPQNAIWCVYQDNTQVCGRTDNGTVPGKIMTATEGTYRDAIEQAGDERYPYIKGAGNRMSSGATALAAVTAATPMQFAAYTGVFAGRVVLRIFVFAGLIAALGVLVWPQVLRRIGKTVGSAAATILLLSPIGSLMTFLTFQLIANPTLFGTIGVEGGLVILAVASILIWLAVKPMKRIGAMLSTATTGNPHALASARHTLTSPVHRFLRRRRTRIPRRYLRRMTPGTSPDRDRYEDQDHDSDLADEPLDADWAPTGDRPESAAARTAALYDPPTTTLPVQDGPSDRTPDERPTTFLPPTGPPPGIYDERPTTVLPIGDRPDWPSWGSPDQPPTRPFTASPRPTESAAPPDRRPPGDIDPHSAPRSDSGVWSVTNLGDIFRPEADRRPPAPAPFPADDPAVDRMIWRPPPPPRTPELVPPTPRVPRQRDTGRADVSA